MNSIKSLTITPQIISLLSAIVIFTSRLSVSIKSISLIICLLLILMTVPFKTLLKTYYQHPIARAAAILFICFIIGACYSDTPFSEKIHVLKNYLPLLWIGFFITFFQSSFPTLNNLFTKHKTQTYTSIFLYGVVLVTFLGCLNAFQIVDVMHLVHKHPTTDPLEYPFGTFSFSLSFAAYLAAQKTTDAIKMKASRLVCYRYIACFLFLTFFIFFINHQRTAYILYTFLLLIYGYQQNFLKGGLYASILLILILVIAFNTSSTFQTRSLAVFKDVKMYYHGNPTSSTGLRFFFLKSSYTLWKEKPFFGYGTGAFKEAYLSLDDGYNIYGQKVTRETALDQPHNDYAYIFVQLGLFGLVAFLWLLSQQFFKAYQLPRFERQCAHAFILSFMLCAWDTTLFFYATSLTDYFFFSALFYAPLKK